ncbi:MAG: hypothetical protein ACK5P7_08540 [Bdellovibrio sp.]|jgi:hypothetical protein
MTHSPVVIVSAFGRGQSLACRLKENEIPVVLIDVSEDLGSSAPEDEEGPFGVFLSGLPPVAQERIHQDDPPHNQAEGAAFVLSSGPLEMKSPLTKNRLEKLGLPLAVLATFRDFRDGKVKSLSDWMSQSLAQSWLVHLAASLAANSYRPFPEGLTSGFMLALDGDFWVRPVTRPGLQQSLDWCARRGVTVHKNRTLLDLAKEERRQLKGLQFRLKSSQTTEILTFDQLVWCLNGEETAFLSSLLQEKLFPQGVMKPQWVWTRFRLRLAACPEREILPFHSVWVRDLDLPWTHDNLLILQKSPSPDLLDAWIRIPANQRLQKNYLSEQLEKILSLLEQKFVTVKPMKAEEPLSAERTYRELGPPRQPLYGAHDLLTFQASSAENLILHSSETWNGLGFNALFKSEEKVLSLLSVWWKKREELRKKT